MGLRLKFNLVLVLVIVFLAGFAPTGLVSRQLLQDNAREEVLRNARLMMDTALSVRAYTVEQVKPHLDKQRQEVFLPQSVPAYAATETLGHIQKKYRDYGYKESTLNPTNPRDRAFKTFMAALAAVFAVVFVALNLMLSWLIVRPIRRMSLAADKVSTGDFDVPEFSDAGRDEVAVLGSSFNRMRRSLEKAMQMIERGN